MKSTIRVGRGSVLAALALALAGPASAGTLATAPFSSGFGGPVTGIDCNVANVGSKDQQVTIEIRDSDELAASQTFDVAPNGAVNLSHFAAGTFYCRFSFKGSAKNLRAAGHAVDANFSPYASEPAR